MKHLSPVEIDQYWMSQAVQLAKRAAHEGEVPVGALLVADGALISRAYNQRERLKSPLGHAEILCIHRASRIKNNWRLEKMTLYVTLEPCLMCSGTILQARIPRLVYGAKDPKAGAVDSLYETLSDSRLNHQVEILGGVLADECEVQLKEFFRELRSKKKLKIGNGPDNIK